MCMSCLYGSSTAVAAVMTKASYTQAVGHVFEPRPDH